MEDPPFPDLCNLNQDLPSNQTDIVIIGSGIAAAAVARSILIESKRVGRLRRVVVLESRDLCSGASGRNVGHLKSMPHELFDRLRTDIGISRARAITRFQLNQIKVLTELCDVEALYAAECREVQAVDFYFTEDDRDEAFEKIRRLQRAIPELTVRMWDEDQVQTLFGVNDTVKGAVSYIAGAMSPYRFVCSVWDHLRRKHKYFLYIKTGTSVLAVQTIQGGDYAYNVVTTAGNIKCNHVVHATNAHATQFIPGLRGKMTGLVGTICAQRPGRRFPDLNGMRSWSLVHGHTYDYATQRPTIDGRQGDIIAGGGFAVCEGRGISTLGRWDDDQVDPIPVAHLRGIFPVIFDPLYGSPSRAVLSRPSWSAVTAITGDLLPFVGRLDPSLTGRMPDLQNNRAVRRGERPSEYVSAGYADDGMTWAWFAGTAIGVMIVGTEKEEVRRELGYLEGRLDRWFPPELEPTPDRIAKASLKNLSTRFFWSLLAHRVSWNSFRNR
ncbi:FAD dependent oxidoreductase-domain-containing protein [Hypomontagnella monticulosa]|nr:FAD dependent oxidoreductase-domain-containing protein [Hypomontagnella monticulosa]